jgi:TPR repeat protein
MGRFQCAEGFRFGRGVSANAKLALQTYRVCAEKDGVTQALIAIGDCCREG